MSVETLPSPSGVDTGDSDIVHWVDICSECMSPDGTFRTLCGLVLEREDEVEPEPEDGSAVVNCVVCEDLVHYMTCRVCGR